jgi:hypothetical protein
MVMIDKSELTDIGGTIAVTDQGYTLQVELRKKPGA